MGHPKRMKMDGSVKDDHRDKGKSFDRSKQKRDRGIDGPVHKKMTRKRSIYDSFSDSESESHVIDWFSLVKIPLPKLKERKTSVMEGLKAGAIFSKIGVSVELAGPELSNQIQSLVSTHMKERFGDHQIPWEVTPDVFGGHSQGNSVASFVKEHIHRMETLYDIGSCRRALTARVDYNMRKKLRNNKKVCFLYVHVHVCIYMYDYVYTYVCMCVYIYICMYMYVCMYVCMYICTCICT